MHTWLNLLILVTLLVLSAYLVEITTLFVRAFLLRHESPDEITSPAFHVYVAVSIVCAHTPIAAIVKRS